MFTIHELIKSRLSRKSKISTFFNIYLEFRTAFCQSLPEFRPCDLPRSGSTRRLWSGPGNSKVQNNYFFNSPIQTLLKLKFLWKIINPKCIFSINIKFYLLSNRQINNFFYLSPKNILLILAPQSDIVDLGLISAEIPLDENAQMWDVVELGRL